MMMNPHSYPKMRLLELSGAPCEMGRQHGLAYPEEIKALTEDRLQLSSSTAWTGKALSRQTVLDLGQACLPYHEAYAPDLMEELRGIREVTGLGLAELVILNGFTDFIDLVYNVDAVSLSAQTASTSAPLGAETAAHPALDDCTAFVVHPDSTTGGQGFYGQTWDMHETATPFVILLHGRPDHGLDFLTLTIIGCVGMIGMNEAGIAIGINNLVDGQGQVGVTWPFVVRRVLAQDNLADALACITEARLAGAHNYMLVDATGQGYNVEAMATRYHVDEINTGAFVHTNHCLLPQTCQVERLRLPKSRLGSETRLSRGQTLLDAGQITLADLIALTRDHGATNGICVHPDEPFFVESCAAAIMRPATRELWAVWGNPCVNEYVKFAV
jgi:isopenicillin-N N-acyltransferase-like protein